ncbi:MAG TPA: glycoside hydrolase family 99-like domain-containing protein [Casimicrobiaceae bacterium]
MSDVKLIAFYLPQFHPIPENDAWWGKGFTEWTNVRQARPNFVGHYQPHLPGELGYYDLRTAETRIAQAELARTHGIHGFCYYYYWFNGRRLLHRPLDEVVQSGAPDFPFCVCWANENWTRRWDGGNDELLVAQTYSPENERALIADLAPLFRDPRYIRVRGRPLLLVYRANLLPEPRRATDIFRSVMLASGEPEPYLAMVRLPGMSPPSEWGFDAGVEFPPHSMEVNLLTEHIEKLNPKFVGDVWDYVSAARYAIARPLPDFPLFRAVMVGWDNTPRLQDNAQVFVNTHPQNYGRWLAAMIAQTRQSRPADERFVFINAWNEWGEGCHLEPDARFGRGYLEATHAALQPPTPLKDRSRP